MAFRKKGDNKRRNCKHQAYRGYDDGKPHCHSVARGIRVCGGRLHDNKEEEPDL